MIDAMALPSQPTSKQFEDYAARKCGKSSSEAENPEESEVESSLEETNHLESVITDLVESIVGAPDQVAVTGHVVGALVTFSVKTKQDDVRRVIGQKGKHFKAINIIAAEAGRRFGMEAHVAIDEELPASPVPTVKGFALGGYNEKKFKGVEALLRRVISLFVTYDVTITTKEIGTTVMAEVRIRAADYPLLYGKNETFDYGTDGHIIGAIKNFFDGVAKNHGRVIRIAVKEI